MALVTDLTIHPSFEQAKKLRLGAQSVTLLNTLRDPTQLRRHKCATRQQQPFYGCTMHIVVLFRAFDFSAPNHVKKDIL